MVFGKSSYPTVFLEIIIPTRIQFTVTGLIITDGCIIPGRFFSMASHFTKKTSLEKVLASVPDSTTKDTEGSTYTWYCESDADFTTIWANFHKYNPNHELIEISTRRTCIYPEQEGINYLTISGFHISQAATQWASADCRTGWNGIHTLVQRMDH